MYGRYEREQKQVAERTGVAVLCRSLKKFPEDAVGRMRSVVGVPAGAQVGDKIGDDRKCGQQGTGIGELPVALLARGFGELHGQTLFQTAD